VNLHIETDAAHWNATLLQLPDPHVLQSWEWGELKGQTGWTARRLLWLEGREPRAAASLLLRRLRPLPLGVAYVPKGPLLDWNEAGLAEVVLQAIEAQARRRGAIFVKIDPDVSSEGEAGPAVISLLQRRGWRPSPEQIQFRNTALIDLRGDEEAWLAAMKPKWRYNIRLAGRRGVKVRPGDLADLPAFYRLYQETGRRDGFLVRPYAYYEQTWRRLMRPDSPDSPGAHLLLAEAGDKLLAGLILFRFGPTAWYFYGASSGRQRKLMPNHLLQWEAMRLARSLGCSRYDLWGAPDVLDEGDSMWGVWRFKQGFGASFAPHIGAWDFPVSRPLYWAYTGLMPRVLDFVRRRHVQN